MWLITVIFTAVTVLCVSVEKNDVSGTEGLTSWRSGGCVG